MMTTRGTFRFGLLSLMVAVVGAAGIGACSDDEAVGSGGASAGGGGKPGAGAGGGGGKETAGSGGSLAGGGATSIAGKGGGDDLAGSAGEPGMAGAGTGGEAGGAPLTPSAEVKKLSPLPALPADTTNQYADNAAAATLGQKLFFDKRYSGPLKVAGPLGAIGDSGKVACVTCHAGGAMADGREPFNVTLGTDFHTRNAPALVNSAFYQWTNWAGRFAAQWELPLAVAENPITMNSNRLKLAHFIYDTYKTEYESLFGALDPALAHDALDKARFPAEGKPKAAGAIDGDWELMAPADRTVVNRIIVNFGKALQAYIRKLVSRDAPFDQYVASGGGSLSESAKRGAELFVGKAKCSSCHSGPSFSDDLFHNLGVRQDSTVLHEPASDDGRMKDGLALLTSALNVNGDFSDDKLTGRLDGLTNPLPDSTKAQFRTASLREVADTAPYMHSGQLATLEDVVKFYVAGGGTPAAGTTKDPLLTSIALDEAEQADLVAFLKTLSGAAIPAVLTVDTSGQ